MDRIVIDGRPRIFVPIDETTAWAFDTLEDWRKSFDERLAAALLRAQTRRDRRS